MKRLYYLNIKKYMKKAKIRIKQVILDRISNSSKLTDPEKVSFFKYVWYMTTMEQKNLVNII